MYTERKKILIVAGEASGDMHAASLVKEIRRLCPSATFYGVGGKNLRGEGVELVADAADMAVIGLTEVVFKLPFLLKVFNRLRRSLTEERPDITILVDYPDFNLRLAKAAHRAGSKVFYYISPQVWAWRRGRVRQIRRYVDEMAVILPFEVQFYRNSGIEVTFVGHPLLDRIPSGDTRNEARRSLGLRDDLPTVSILPGSRPSEIARILPLCMQALAEINGLCPVQCLLPLAEGLSRSSVESMTGHYGVKVAIISDSIYHILTSSDVAIVASGTATLEAALLEIPMIILYRVSWLSYMLGRLFIRVKNIGLVNIIAGRCIVPELIQTDAKPKRIAELAYTLLADGSAREAMREELSKIKGKLGNPGAARRTAECVCRMLGVPGSA